MTEDPLAPQEGNWSMRAGELELAMARPVLATLDDVGMLTVRGPDAVTFLNGQLTIDVARIGAEGWQLGAYCSVKGRVLAIFEAWRDDDAFHLVMPRERVAVLASRLSRYILRAKVSLHADPGEWLFWGLTGPGLLPLLGRAGLRVPQAPWTHCTCGPGLHLARLPASPATGDRLLLLAAPGTDGSWRRSLSELAQVGSPVWWWSKIDAGLPDVFLNTEERYVPQSLNLDVLGGIHFGKGCYPGQEVVARSQYLGKLKRRMFHAHASSALAGEDVRSEGSSGEGIGSVVMAAGSPGGGVDLLLECPTDAAQGGFLRLAREGPVELALRPVPYPIINPTA